MENQPTTVAAHPMIATAHRHLCRLASVITLSALLVPFCAAAPSDAQHASWSERRSQASLLRQRANNLREEADTIYAAEETQCYEQILTNRCREEARRKKVSAYQQAKKHEIEGRQLELSVRREEKAQKDIDFAASIPEREFKIKERTESTKKRNQQQIESHEKALEKRRQKTNDSDSHNSTQ